MFIPQQLADFPSRVIGQDWAMPIPKQIPSKGNGMTIIGPNEYLGVEWVLGQEVIGTILNMQFQVGAHSSTMNAIGS